MKNHLKILYLSFKRGYSYTVIVFVWFILGIAFMVFFNLLYLYIYSHGGSVATSTYYVYRNMVFGFLARFFGPLVGALSHKIPKIERKGTMCISSLGGMAILFGYTTVKTQDGDAGFTCATYFFSYHFFSVLNDYTLEVLPANARTTGGCFAMCANRFGSAFAPLIYYFGQRSGSSVSIWICGAFYGLTGFMVLTLPYEPLK